MSTKTGIVQGLPDASDTVSDAIKTLTSVQEKFHDHKDEATEDLKEAR